MTKNKEPDKPKPPPKNTKSQGLVAPGRSTFINEIIRKVESQAPVGPRRGSTWIPLERNLPTAAQAEVHSGNEGIEQSFQNTYLPPLIPLDEGNSCNLEEGEGETSRVAKANPSPPPNPRYPMIGEGIPEIPDRGSAIKFPRGSSNQSPQIEHPGQ
jgi:hypothetical protein